MKLRNLRDQRIVILGASSGIGRQTALDMCKKGVQQMVVSSRSQQGIESLVQEMQVINPQGHFFGFLCDCTSTQSVQQLAIYSLQQMERIDTWVQNSAIMIFSTMMDTSEEEFLQIFNTNVLGACRATWTIVPLLKQQYQDAKIRNEKLFASSIVYVGSVEAKRALPYQAAYSASKHALDGMIEALRMELRKEKAPIHIAHIMPSGIDTPLYENCKTKIQDPEHRLYKPIPPSYTPDLVSRGIMHAATHKYCRDLIIGDVGYLITWFQFFTPSVLDSIMVTVGFSLERSHQVKQEEDNMTKPLDKYNRARGGWGSKPLHFSLYNTIREKLPW